MSLVGAHVHVESEVLGDAEGDAVGFDHCSVGVGFFGCVDEGDVVGGGGGGVGWGVGYYVPDERGDLGVPISFIAYRRRF